MASEPTAQSAISGPVPDYGSRMHCLLGQALLEVEKVGCQFHFLRQNDVVQNAKLLELTAGWRNRIMPVLGDGQAAPIGVGFFAGILGKA